MIYTTKPLVVNPELAKAIGLNESIFIQQLHYWIGISGNKKDGKKWVYNTYNDWLKQFPFFSLSTLKRIVKKLSQEEYIFVENYNKMAADKTNWYALNYEKIEQLTVKKQRHDAKCQNEPSKVSKWTDGECQNEPSNTRDYSEITNTIVAYLNQQADKNYKSTTAKTKSLIRARLNDGFTLSDFQRVIDQKAKDWKGDTKFDRYLRPETLFSTKFESYLNESPTPKKSSNSSSYRKLV